MCIKKLDNCAVKCNRNQQLSPHVALYICEHILFHIARPHDDPFSKRNIIHYVWKWCCILNTVYKQPENVIYFLFLFFCVCGAQARNPLPPSYTARANTQKMWRIFLAKVYSIYNIIRFSLVYMLYCRNSVWVKPKPVEEREPKCSI